MICQQSSFLKKAITLRMLRYAGSSTVTKIAIGQSIRVAKIQFPLHISDMSYPELALYSHRNIQYKTHGEVFCGQTSGVLSPFLLRKCRVMNEGLQRL